VKAVVNFPEPRNIKQLKRIIGLFNWLSKFIPNFSALISPLTKLLQKDQKFAWKIEQSTAFQNLKFHLVNSNAHSFPRFDLPFTLSVDTSSQGIRYTRQTPQRKNQVLIVFGQNLYHVLRTNEVGITGYGNQYLRLCGLFTWYNIHC
jgi:hypothetical protein